MVEAGAQRRGAADRRGADAAAISAADGCAVGARRSPSASGSTRAFAFSSPMAQYALDLPGLRCVRRLRRHGLREMGRVRAAAPVADFGPLRQGGGAAARLRAGDRGAGRGQHLRHPGGSEALLRRGARVRRHASSPSATASTASTSRRRRIRSRRSRRRAAHRLHRRDGLLAECRCGARGSPARCCPRSEGAMRSARFYVVGMNPDAAVRALASDAAVVVTGRVADVRPYLQHARVVVAPLRVARGIQNKVLEAMAMAKPVVVTHADGRRAVGATRASSSRSRPMRRQFAEKVLALMDPERARRMGAAARARVLQRLRLARELCAARRAARARRRRAPAATCGERSRADGECAARACRGECARASMKLETEPMLRPNDVAESPRPSRRRAGWRIALPLVVAGGRRDSRDLLAHGRIDRRDLGALGNVRARLSDRSDLRCADLGEAQGGGANRARRRITSASCCSRWLGLGVARRRRWPGAGRPAVRDGGDDSRRGHCGRGAPRRAARSRSRSRSCCSACRSARR